MSVHDDTIHICNGCGNAKHVPECIPENVQFGNGFGNDNIIHCKNYNVEDVIAKIKGEAVTNQEEIQARENVLDVAYRKSLIERNEIERNV